MKPIKQKKCKSCKELFTPFTSLSAVCSLECAVELTNKKSKAKWRKEKKEMKENLKTNSDWLKDAQKVVNKYIRERDKNNPYCISCGKIINGVRHASHYLSAGHNTSVRFNTDNIWVSCYKCNVMLAGNQTEYRIRLIEKIGVKRVEYLESIAKETKRYSVDELKDIIKGFKEMIKQLK